MADRPPNGYRRARFAVMGTEAEITVPSATPTHLVAGAVDRLNELEQLWSRFRPSSEVSRMTARAGRPVVVGDDTLLLVACARRAHRLTAGRYDPTVLASVVAAGYDRDFALVAGDGRDTGRSGATPVPDRTANTSIEIDEVSSTVALAVGTGFDPGGLGKGLAADLVSGELALADVESGCVSVGGDLRVWGPGPHDGGWHVGVAGRTVATTDVGVATSSTAERRWRVGDVEHHHVIDPATGRSSTTDVVSATVIAPSGWLADACAVAAVLAGSAAAPGLLAQWGVDGVVVDRAGRRRATARLAGCT